MTGNKYKTASAMRAALEGRLNKISKEKGIDIMRLRRNVAFDRFLARIFQNDKRDIIVKGGYALELRFDYARTTKDIDISFQGNLNGFWSNNDNELLRQFLQNKVSVNLDDYFEFIIGKVMLDIDHSPYGGFRYPIEVRMDGRVFIKFHIDVAAGDTWIEPHEIVNPNNWLEFAGIEPPKVRLISFEQQFAEKLHSLTLPREKPNSRVKDLADLIALIDINKLDPDKAKLTMRETFKRRKTHSFPPEFPEISNSWAEPFKRLINEYNIKMEISEAIIKIKAYCLDNGLILIK